MHIILWAKIWAYSNFVQNFRDIFDFRHGYHMCFRHNDGHCAQLLLSWPYTYTCSRLGSKVCISKGFIWAWLEQEMMKWYRCISWIIFSEHIETNWNLLNLVTYVSKYMFLHSVVLCTTFLNLKTLKQYIRRKSRRTCFEIFNVLLWTA